MWVGLSAKKATSVDDFTPLHADTNTGKLVAEIEAQCPGATFYKTNLVKIPPLDSKGKLRYPTLEECALYYPELQIEFRMVDPQIILLLGIKTATFVLKQYKLQMPKLSYEYQVFEYKKRWYVPIHHPSYFMVYKRKEKNQYIQAVKAVIERLIP